MDELQKIKKKETITVENLWQVIESHQGETFLTVKHLPFTYTIKGGELFTDRKRKSITRSTFEKAYIRVQEEPESITGPKTLNVFGSALYLGFVSGLWRGGREKEEKLTEEIPGNFCRSRGFLRVICPLLS
ncbi:MAG: hypothetical protein ACLR2E_11575 [Lachnospiraceae bacterium]